jgi:5-methylcytosine-specific restriction endonuclease McrA
VGCCGCSGPCRNSSVARHTHALPLRQGTLTHRISWARGGSSAAIGLPPVRVRVIRYDLCRSLPERQPLYTRTGGSGAGATMVPAGEDHVKGQACLGCKRNSLLLESRDGLLQDYWRQRRSQAQATAGRPGQLTRRQQGLCPVCHQALDNHEDLHVPHVVPKKHGGTDELAHLRLVHHNCHRQIHSTAHLLGYVDGLSRVPGDRGTQVCGEGLIAISPPYPTKEGIEPMDVEHFPAGIAPIRSVCSRKIPWHLAGSERRSTESQRRM